MIDLARELLLPPGINLVLLVIGFLFLAPWPKFGYWCLLIGIITLYMFSIAPVATWLIATVEKTPAMADPMDARGEQAIVVLGSGRYYDAPEYDGDTVSRYGLERLRYAQYLQEQTRLPILMTGGRPHDDFYSEAELMEEIFKDIFGGITMWTEQRSRNTFENAVCSKRILEGENISRIFLVTHASHMPRAMYVFDRVDFGVTPAPTGYLRDVFSKATTLEKWLPTASALSISRTALYEWLGLFYYRINYGSEDAVRTAPARC
jgi:uncharacterized SAM-binding protein YcdF (DUF218 family)